MNHQDWHSFQEEIKADAAALDKELSGAFSSENVRDVAARMAETYGMDASALGTILARIGALSGKISAGDGSPAETSELNGLVTAYERAYLACWEARPSGGTTKIRAAVKEASRKQTDGLGGVNGHAA